MLRKTLYSLYESDRGLLDLQFSYSKSGQLLFKILEIFEFKHGLSKIQVGRSRQAPRRRAHAPAPSTSAPARRPTSLRPRTCAALGHASPQADAAPEAPQPHTAVEPYARRGAADRRSFRSAARTRAGQGCRGTAESAPSPRRHRGTRALFKAVVSFSSRHPHRSRPPHRATTAVAAELTFPRLSSAE
jgi:hypothetical protein